MRINEAFATTRNLTSSAPKRKIEVIAIDDDSDSSVDILDKQRAEIRRNDMLQNSRKPKIGALRNNKKSKMTEFPRDLLDDDEILELGTLKSIDGSLKVKIPEVVDRETEKKLASRSSTSNCYRLLTR